MAELQSVAFIGGGNMAEAIIAGLLRSKALEPGGVVVSEPLAERRQELNEVYKIRAVDSNREAVEAASVVVLAVKPFKLDEIKDEIRPALTGEHLIVSILAGASRARLGAALGHEERCVRVMPNLPALVGSGVSAVSFPAGLGESEREQVREILRSVGAVVEVDEPQQDAVTAVSGSGPGYVFYLVDRFIEAARAEGLEADVAHELAIRTFVGAAEVLKQGQDSPAALVKKVATPGGTTEAGLNALDEAGAGAMLRETVRRAAERSRELNRS